MTVTATNSRTVLAGNGAATVFPFTFHCTDPATLSVIYIDPLGAATTLPPSSYTVTLNTPPAEGGSVTYAPPTGPIPPNSTLVILRTLPLTQPVNILNQSAFYPSVVTDEFDALVMVDQQLADGLSRALLAPISDPPGLNYTAPSVPQRAGMVAGWDAQGNVVAVVQASTTVQQVSTALFGALPTTPPATPGVLWDNGGVLCRS